VLCGSHESWRCWAPPPAHCAGLCHIVSGTLMLVWPGIVGCIKGGGWMSCFLSTWNSRGRSGRLGLWAQSYLAGVSICCIVNVTRLRASLVVSELWWPGSMFPVTHWISLEAGCNSTVFTFILSVLTTGIGLYVIRCNRVLFFLLLFECFGMDKWAIYKRLYWAVGCYSPDTKSRNITSG
jgi:hypothetical protein